MIISVASGKGGTGKTTVAVNLALSLKNVQLLDCDVEEPNAHLFLKTEFDARIRAKISIPEFDPEKCDYCGKCASVCMYNALAVISPSNGEKGNVLFFSHLCHGCAACMVLCPHGAVREAKKEIGTVEIDHHDEKQFIQGKLDIREIMSPHLIRQVKEFINPTRTVIIDAPPGTTCPVIAAVNDTDFCVLVTEPTPFGLNDLVLAVDLLRKLNVPFGVVINRCDIGDDKVERYCEDGDIPVLLKIPFDREIAVLYSHGVPLIEKKPEYRPEFLNMFDKIREIVDLKSKRRDA